MPLLLANKNRVVTHTLPFSDHAGDMIKKRANYPVIANHREPLICYIHSHFDWAIAIFTGAFQYLGLLHYRN